MPGAQVLRFPVERTIRTVHLAEPVPVVRPALRSAAPVSAPWTLRAVALLLGVAVGLYLASGWLS